MSEKKNRAAEEKEQAAAAAEPAENTEESAVETPVEEAASAPEPDPALVKAQQEAAEYKDKWIRSVAEFENFRKRNADTRHTSYMEGRADIIVKVLPVGDNLERALATCDEKTKKGLLRHLVARMIDSLSVTIVINGKSLPKAEVLYERLKAQFGDIALYISENTKNTNVIMGDTISLIFGKEQKQSLGAFSAAVSPLSCALQTSQTKVQGVPAVAGT